MLPSREAGNLPDDDVLVLARLNVLDERGELLAAGVGPRMSEVGVARDVSSVDVALSEPLVDGVALVGGFSWVSVEARM